MWNEPTSAFARCFFALFVAIDSSSFALPSSPFSPSSRLVEFCPQEKYYAVRIVPSQPVIPRLVEPLASLLRPPSTRIRFNQARSHSTAFRILKLRFPKPTLADAREWKSRMSPMSTRLAVIMIPISQNRPVRRQTDVTKLLKAWPSASATSSLALDRIGMLIGRRT